MFGGKELWGAGAPAQGALSEAAVVAQVAAGCGRSDEGAKVNSGRTVDQCTSLAGARNVRIGLGCRIAGCICAKKAVWCLVKRA